MENEFPVKSKDVELELTGENVTIENRRDKIISEDELRFVKQQEINLKIKEAMAEELRAMELPDYVVNEILNIEDEPPF